VIRFQSNWHKGVFLMNFVFAFKITLRPCWPWSKKHPGFLSIFWFHFLIKIGRYVQIINPKFQTVLSVEESKWREAMKTADPTKRASLQPGDRPLPKGYREMDHVDGLFNVDEGKPLQPGNTREEDKELEEKVKDMPFVHRFFGSMLLLGNTPIIRNLDRTMHEMEIMENGQVYIDKKVHNINPHDLLRLKLELIKNRKKSD